MRMYAGSGMMLVLAAMMLSLPARVNAQAEAAASAPAVGTVAPDFTLPGATRYGLLRSPVRLADYRGQTVVLAFFYQARTKG